MRKSSLGVPLVVGGQLKLYLFPYVFIAPREGRKLCKGQNNVLLNCTPNL